jgi:hypothetical protein
MHVVEVELDGSYAIADSIVNADAQPVMAFHGNADLLMHVHARLHHHRLMLLVNISDGSAAQ